MLTGEIPLPKKEVGNLFPTSPLRVGPLCGYDSSYLVSYPVLNPFRCLTYVLVSLISFGCFILKF